MNLDSSPGVRKSLVNRAKSIVLQPKLEWPVIAAESASVGGLFTGYAAILAIIGPICLVIGSIIFKSEAPLFAEILAAILSFVGSLLGVFILGHIINVLGPNFGAQKDIVQSMKVAVYASTPIWIAGIFNLVPALGLISLVAIIYSWFLVYTGIKTVKAPPQDKVLVYSIVAIIVSAIISGILMMVPLMIVGLIVQM